MLIIKPPSETLISPSKKSVSENMTPSELQASKNTTVLEKWYIDLFQNFHLLVVF